MVPGFSGVPSTSLMRSAPSQSMTETSRDFAINRVWIALHSWIDKADGTRIALGTASALE